MNFKGPFDKKVGKVLKMLLDLWEVGKKDEWLGEILSIFFHGKHFLPINQRIWFHGKHKSDRTSHQITHVFPTLVNLAVFVIIFQFFYQTHAKLLF